MSSPQGETEIRACHVSSVGTNVNVFLRGQLDYLRQYGFHYMVITSELTREGMHLPADAEYRSVPITRFVTPLTDLRSIWRMLRIFRLGRFDLVQYTTPKGALLGSIAAYLARVPVRLRLFWGIYYVTQVGWKRRLLKAMDWMICRLSTHMSFDSEDNRQFGISEGLCSPANSSCVGHGSANGVDLALFDPESSSNSRWQIREELHIPPDATVIGGVMRIVRDKGINELVAAFNFLSEKWPNLYLLLVGSQEEKNCPEPATMAWIKEHPRIVAVDFQENIMPYYSAMDVFVLPSYREGCGVVCLEAQAMKLPVVTTDVLGARETIAADETGLLVPATRVAELAEAIDRLVRDPGLRQRMGDAGRRRILANYEQNTFWESLRRQREELLICHAGFVRCQDRVIRR